MNPYRIIAHIIKDNLGVNPDGTIIDHTNKAMIIVDMDDRQGNPLHHATAVFRTDSDVERRRAIAQTMGAVCMLLVSQWFPEDTPRYSMTYDDQSKEYKHQFEGMPEDLKAKEDALCHS